MTNAKKPCREWWKIVENIRFLKLFSGKGAINKPKRPTTNKKITEHIWQRDVYLNIRRSLTDQPKQQQQQKQRKKWWTLKKQQQTDKNMNRQVTKEKVEIIYKYMKRCLIFVNN